MDTTRLGERALGGIKRLAKQIGALGAVYVAILRPLAV
jgi:hypothetical protein